MTDAAAATAAPMEIELGGRKLLLSPLTHKDVGELSQWIRARMIRDARESLTPDMTPDQRYEAMEFAHRAAMSASFQSIEGIRIAGTVEGVARVSWHGIRHNHPDITFDNVLEMFMQYASQRVDDAAINRVMDAFNVLNPTEDAESPGVKAEEPETAKET